MYVCLFVCMYTYTYTDIYTCIHLAPGGWSSVHPGAQDRSGVAAPALALPISAKHTPLEHNYKYKYTQYVVTSEHIHI